MARIPVVTLTFLLPLAGILATYFWSHNIGVADKLYEQHCQVLEGKAYAATQYQNPLNDAVLEGLFRVSPRQTPGWFAVCYTCYYSLGLTLFVVALYRTCRLFGTPLCSSVACLYLVAILPMFWYDNWYHPGDSWGALLAVLLVRALCRPKVRGGYYLLLLASSFLWEKHVLFPLSRAMADWNSGKRRLAVILNLAVDTVLAASGQIIYRLYYGFHAAGVGSLGENLRNVHWYLFGLAVTQGLAIYFCVRYWQDVPRPFGALLLQTPGWLAIYLVLNGYIYEYRAIFLVSMSYATPLMAMLFDQINGLDRSPQADAV